MTRFKWLRGWVNYFWITLGSIIIAVAIDIFLVPYKIAPGGVSGIATIIYYLSNGFFPVGITMLILNIPLFIAGMKFIGSRFVIRTLYGTVVLSLIIDLIHPFITPTVVSMITGDLLLVSLFGGFLMGLGLALVFRSGATTGGTDLAARMAHKFFPSLTIGQHLLFIDTTVIITASMVFKSFELGLYAIVTLFISSKVIDAILEGVNFAKALYIISDYSVEISERIMKDLDRGVTALKGKGMYTGNDKQVLLCVVHRSQLPQLKEIVKSIDKNAFIILSDIREVLGEGFQDYE